MTTIAWDGITVASDSRMINGAYICQNDVVKMKCVDGVVYAMTGYSCWLDSWIQWYNDGMNPRDAPHTTIPSGNTGNFMVFTNGECQHFTHDLPYMTKLCPPDAWGSGYQFAIGAMLAGVDAIRAVDVAIMADANSGGPVQSYRVQIEDDQT